MRPSIFGLFHRAFRWVILLVSLAFLGRGTVFAAKEVVPKPKLTPTNPASNSSAISISVQVDPTVDVDPTPTHLPNTFALLQNYPNPFNSSTSISYSCAKEGLVTLKVYNILGQEVVTLVAGRMRPGVHSLSWNSRDKGGNLLPSGVYFYRMTTDWYIETKKLVILR